MKTPTPICTTPTYGWDPECFVVLGNHYVPMGGLIPGTKEKPFHINAEGDPDPDSAFAVSEDGATLEVNTPIATTPRAAVRNVTTAFSAASQFLQKHAPFKGMMRSERQERESKNYSYMKKGLFQLHHRGDCDFGQELLGIPSALVMGCDPDFNAYSVVQNGGDIRSSANSRPNVRDLGGYRFAGCHLHIGYPTALMPNYVLVVFADLIAHAVGLQDRSLRRNYYGRPGNFRPTPYGLEYRSLSGAAVSNPERLTQFVRGIHNLLAKDVEWVKNIWTSINVFDIQAQLTEGGSRTKTGLENVISQLVQENAEQDREVEPEEEDDERESEDASPPQAQPTVTLRNPFDEELVARNTARIETAGATFRWRAPVPAPVDPDMAAMEAHRRLLQAAGITIGG